MLKTTGIKPSIRDPISVSENNTVDKIGRGDSKVRAKFMARKNLFKSKNLVKSTKPSSGSGFLNFGARLAFTKLKQAFMKALILHLFDSKSHIRIKTDTSGYVIGGILS